MNALVAWLREASNFYTVIISFVAALIIVLVVNMVFMIRRTIREFKIAKTLFRHGNVVVLKREMLLPLHAIAQGQSGVVQDILDQPRMMAERNVFRKVMVVDFNGTLVALDVSQARRYLILEG